MVFCEGTPRAQPYDKFCVYRSSGLTQFWSSTRVISKMCDLECVLSDLLFAFLSSHLLTANFAQCKQDNGISLQGCNPIWCNDTTICISGSLTSYLFFFLKKHIANPFCCRDTPFPVYLHNEKGQRFAYLYPFSLTASLV